MVVAARDVPKAERAMKDVPGGAVVNLDLASFASVRACADEVLAKYDRLDVLLNNAGIMALPEREITEDGCEKQMQVNHLGHFLLTSRLLPLLKDAADRTGSPARIVNVSSVAHTFPSSFPVGDVNLAAPFAYGGWGWTAYGNSKLANVLFTYELHRRLRSSGIENVNVNAVHPGVVDSELPRNLAFNFYPIMGLLGMLITNDEGARGQTRLCLGEAPFENISGAYVAEMSNAGASGLGGVGRRGRVRGRRARPR